jgi:hypothetical protein
MTIRRRPGPQAPHLHPATRSLPRPRMSTAEGMARLASHLGEAAA